MMLVSMISYIDRNTLALLAPTILDATHLNNFQLNLAIAAFSVAYTLGNPLWGRVLDRIGLRRGMLAAVSLWTVASMAHAFVLACERSPRFGPCSPSAKALPFPADSAP